MSLLSKSKVPVRVSGGVSPLRSLKATGMDWLLAGRIEIEVDCEGERLKSGSVPLASAMD
jgi:hypothetical protein